MHVYRDGGAPFSSSLKYANNYSKKVIVVAQCKDCGKPFVSMEMNTKETDEVVGVATYTNDKGRRIVVWKDKETRDETSLECHCE